MNNFVDALNAKKQGATNRKRSGLDPRVNGRSTDFVAPGLATGCQLFCAYCYVARHRPAGNPLELYTNRDDIWNAVYKHYKTLPSKIANQCDPNYYTYDIGESTDCMSPAMIDSTNWYVSKFLQFTNAKPSFATKLSVSSKLASIKRKSMARVRVSLAPQSIVDLTEKATTVVKNRINSINTLFDLGYEVHINFSPIVIYKGWTTDYIQLFRDIDNNIKQEVKDQLKCEVIFLTHNKTLHDSNMKWFPESDLLWTPEWQEYKTTERGDDTVVRYNQNIKPKAIAKFREMIKEHLSYCDIRYIF